MAVDMVKYYRDRAREYEQVYLSDDPSRLAEQEEMGDAMKRALRGRRVLDVACGTGYWTQRVAETAESVTGTDINDAVLEIARSKGYACPAEFHNMDAYRQGFPDASFTGALASFWFSHIPRDRLDEWIRELHRLLAPGSAVFITDNTFLPGFGGELVRKPGDPNTYKLRTLNDGSKHLIVKNYYAAEELSGIFTAHGGGDPCVHVGRGFWWISYNLASPGRAQHSRTAGY